MTYKVDPAVAKITSPVIAVFDGEEKCYENGKELADDCFDKNYMIVEISARDNAVVLTFEKSKRSDIVNCIGEEAICG